MLEALANFLYFLYCVILIDQSAIEGRDTDRKMKGINNRPAINALALSIVQIGTEL